MNRLVLIDGHAIIHRAYWALPPLTSSSGQQVNAVYGFVNMLLRVVDDLAPKYLSVAFDLPTPTFRHEAYIGYQAKRPAMEEAMKGQIDIVYKVVKEAGIPIYASQGFEADDVIGTLAKQASKKKLIDEIVIVTGDRDMMQLVKDKAKGSVRVYVPIRGLSEAKLYGEKEVKEYLGVKPSQVVDYKALVGDSSDNYPGVPGIGPKTASKLLEKFGNLKNLFKSLEEGKRQENIPPAIVAKLKKGYESAILSQNLAKISTDAPVKLDLTAAKLPDLSKNKKFIEKLQELGFRSIVKRLTGEGKNLKTRSKSSRQMNLL